MNDAPCSPSAAGRHPVLDGTRQPAPATCLKGTPQLRFAGRLGGIRQGRQVACGVSAARPVGLPAGALDIGHHAAARP
jgi:hypothetical protein